MTNSLSRIMSVVGVCGLLLFTVGGCGGGGADLKSEVKATTTTVGQELMDLKKALDSGAITQKEYEQERQKILNRK